MVGVVELPACDEAELIEQVQNGREEAFERLFEVHHGCVVRLAYNVLRNGDGALDVAQEVFTRAYEELPYWRGEARLGTWLYRATLNVCFERIRSEERQRRIRERSSDEREEPLPDERVLQFEVFRAIDRAVCELPPQQQCIFRLKQYWGLPFREIAEKLEITVGGAKASYHKALCGLRERLRHHEPHWASVQ